MPLPDKVHKGLQAIAAAFFLALIECFICFCTAGVVMLEMISGGANKYLSLGVAFLVAIGCNAFIVFNHKIRAFINNSRSHK